MNGVHRTLVKQLNHFPLEHYDYASLGISMKPVLLFWGDEDELINYKHANAFIGTYVFPRRPMQIEINKQNTERVIRNSPSNSIGDDPGRWTRGTYATNAGSGSTSAPIPNSTLSILFVQFVL